MLWEVIFSRKFAVKYLRKDANFLIKSKDLKAEDFKLDPAFHSLFCSLSILRYTNLPPCKLRKHLKLK